MLINQNNTHFYEIIKHNQSHTLTAIISFQNQNEEQSMDISKIKRKLIRSLSEWPAKLLRYPLYPILDIGLQCS